MTDLQTSGPVQPGEVLDGRYRLDELIGEGGMGSVWRASDDALGRTVAVKIFAPGTTEDSDAVRRESEKRLLASVSHPSLVTLFDAHLTPDSRSYLVMEYIDGGTLAGVISGGPIDPRDGASLAADLGEALHVVHAAGIIHRDVKPANILLRPPLTPQHTFRAVLADFGIAYLVDAARVTTPGTAIGTAAYISPEQVRGHAPTPESDIYSLGLVLLEALSGRRPFPQQTPIEAISARLTSPPDVPADWGYGWRSLLTAMTAIDPDERPTAIEVSARGRDLDTEDQAGPESTRAIDADPTATRVMIAGAPVAPAARIPDAPTRVLPPPTDATVVMGEQSAARPRDTGNPSR
ncbi:MAG: serine/threonine-protein kinase, partial [Myxococcota bacterium]